MFILQIKNLNAYHKTKKEEIDTEESEITNNQLFQNKKD